MMSSAVSKKSIPAPPIMIFDCLQPEACWQFNHLVTQLAALGAEINKIEVVSRICSYPIDTARDSFGK